MQNVRFKKSQSERTPAGGEKKASSMCRQSHAYCGSVFGDKGGLVEMGAGVNPSREEEKAEAFRRQFTLKGRVPKKERRKRERDFVSRGESLTAPLEGSFQASIVR